jgi:glycosyltransferase involved in cell wall biosynthesis
MATEWLAGVCAQDVICIAPSVRDRAVADGVFRESKVRVIGDGSSNGINLEKYLRSSVDLGERGHMQEELGLQGHFVYGFVGRLVDRKGINELIAAFDRLYRDNSDIRLLLVGAEDSSQLSDLGLLEFIEKHPGIRSIGFSRKVPEALSLMDVFVLPSWWEGFGNAYLEAAAMGLPVIGTTGTGCRDAVKDGFNGVLVPIKDQDAVYWAMKRYLDDGELRKFHGGNGPQWAAHFRPETVWSGLKELYERFPRS